MSGYLRFKKGRHGWKRAWFVLKNNVLYSYKASSVSGGDARNKIGRITYIDREVKVFTVTKSITGPEIV